MSPDRTCSKPTQRFRFNKTALRRHCFPRPYLVKPRQHLVVEQLVHVIMRAMPALYHTYLNVWILGRQGCEEAADWAVQRNERVRVPPY